MHLLEALGQNTRVAINEDVERLDRAGLKLLDQILVAHQQKRFGVTSASPRLLFLSDRARYMSHANGKGVTVKLVEH